MSRYISSIFKNLVKLTALLSLSLVSTLVVASTEFNFAQSTPVGSWAVREDLNTDHKGKQNVSVTKFSVVDKENVDGKMHYWIEMETQNFTLKKDKRKKQGDPSIFKVLVDADMFTSSAANAVGNLSKHAKTIVIQSGNNDPMIIDQGGMLGESMMKAMGIQIDFTYTQSGTKKVEVPAGKFSCNIFKGSGTTETKIVFKTFKISSQTEGCFSNSIPFGMISAETRSTTNGKPSTNKIQLMEFGKSGAKTAITKTPKEGPKIPKLF